jgi:hypothetical protein
VIQCLIQSAVTSLRPPAKLTAGLAKGALGAWTSENQGRAHRIFGAPFLYGAAGLFGGKVQLFGQTRLAGAPSNHDLNFMGLSGVEYPRCRIRHVTSQVEWPNAA